MEFQIQTQFWIQFILFFFGTNYQIPILVMYTFQLPWFIGKPNSVSTRRLFILCLYKKFTRREDNAGRCRRQRPALFSLQIDQLTPLYLNVGTISNTRAYLQLFQSPYHFAFSTLGLFFYLFSLQMMRLSSLLLYSSSFSFVISSVFSFVPYSELRISVLDNALGTCLSSFLNCLKFDLIACMVMRNLLT